MPPTRGALLLALAAVGCEAATPPPPAPPVEPPPAPHSSLPTPHSASLAGRVVWSGPVPPAETVNAFRYHPDGSFTALTRPVPNRPIVGPDGGVSGAVVFLRGVDPAHYFAPGESPGAKWPPVTVELHDERPMIRQGDGPPDTVGFVRRGDEITVVSRQRLFHSLRARGAAFWTLTLPDPDRPRSRRLDRAGVVELSSGVTYFWMHAHLWVCDHPYFARTDAAGRWSLTGVPPGEYEVVAWLPDWRLARRERDPETGGIARYVFRPPLEVARRVAVRENEAVAVGDVVVGP
jgi:hypothetical protein